MNLPLAMPYPVAEALSVEEAPAGLQWSYEPKWDGFRCLAFRDGGEVALQSKGLKPLGRYFPDVVEELLALDAPRFVLDGELVIPIGRQLSFEALQLRLHPAASRVATLVRAHRAVYVLFDLLVDEEGVLLAHAPFAARRETLERFAARHLRGREALRLSPASASIEQARAWFRATGNALDGIVAKRLDLDYRSGTREGMVKVKNIRTADCVVGGFRYAARGHAVGSLLLGLYDRAGLLHHVGFTSAIDRAERGSLVKRLEALQRKGGAPAGFTGRSPGGPSRWAPERSGEYEPLPHELVVEVTYDHFTGGRFRHGAGFVRWRPDKPPGQCLLESVEPAETPGFMKLLA